MARLDPAESARLFGQEGLRTARLMAYLLTALILMAMDQRGHYVPRLRAAMMYALEPVFRVVQLPARAVQGVRTYTTSFQTLLDTNQRQARQLLDESGKLQQMAALRQENRRLRALLDATRGHNLQFRFAELIQVQLDPFAHQVLIDRGSRDGVFVGQAVLDGAGVMGQVESVQLHQAEVRLISDPDHALPVQIVRTGQRTVAYGTGDATQLALPNLPLQSDVRAGDMLVTSGLGERFPPGFPVAMVEKVSRDTGATFATVEARPLAALERGKEVLLVVPGTPAEEDTPTTEPAPPQQPGSGDDDS